jgi:GntR family transcriptional regulator/MocR family aminotransferase
MVRSEGPLDANAAYHFAAAGFEWRNRSAEVKEQRRSWADLYAWQLTRGGDAPLFRQIYLQIRSAILSQSLRPGTKLPSTRELASQLAVSRSAVVSAYEQLLAEGYASGKIGSGSYVSSDLPPPVEGRSPKRGKRPGATTRAAAFEAPLRHDFVDVTVQSDERPFNLGRTLVDARTTELWRKIGTRVFRSLGYDHFGYSDPRGLPGLRKAICDYLRAARAVQCEPEQIVVTAGTQQAIDLVIRVLHCTDMQAWTEDPGYSLTRQALIAAGVKTHSIPVDGQGIDVGAGIRSAPRARAVFVTPSHQFPTGVVLSMTRRLELLNWARDAKAWIVEDDYASEFRYGGRALASLQGLDDRERVIYVGTLNKALFPGLRLGYAVVPPALLKAFVTARYLIDRQPSSLAQAVVADFIEEGHFAAHLRRMRLQYKDQRDVLVAALRHRLADEMTVDPPDQGMHLVAYLRRGLSDVAIERAARDHGVIVGAMSRLYAAAPPRSALVMGFSGYPRPLIPPAVARLAKAFGRPRMPA